MVSPLLLFYAMRIALDRLYRQIVVGVDADVCRNVEAFSHHLFCGELVPGVLLQS